MEDINGKGQIYDIYDLEVNCKRCRIQRSDLEKVFVHSKVGLNKLAHGQIVELSERELIKNAMQIY